MSAEHLKAIESSQFPQKLAIIAGAGTLPRDLYYWALYQGIDCHVIGFKGYTNYIMPDMWGQIGRSKDIIDYLKKNHIQDLVFIGSIKKPNILKLKPDCMTFRFFLKAWIRSLGDSSLLNAVKTEVQEMGFNLHGIHEYMPELLMDSGYISQTDSKDLSQDDLYIAVKAALEHGAQDKGQAVILYDGKVIAQEDRKGTNHLIKEYGCKDSILVKMCKPQQDKNMDMPTIGPETVSLCAEKQMAGIVGHAYSMLITDKKQVEYLADKYGLFILGYTP